MAKSKKLNKEEQQLVEELRKEKAEDEAHKARKEQARKEEATQREPFEEHKDIIEKAVNNCEGHLRQLKNLQLAREVLRRLNERVKEGLLK